MTDRQRYQQIREAAATDDVPIIEHLDVLEQQVLEFFRIMQDGHANPRWVAIAKTHIEEGFMAANRSLLDRFKPAV